MEVAQNFQITVGQGHTKKTMNEFFLLIMKISVHIIKNVYLLVKVIVTGIKGLKSIIMGLRNANINFYFF